LVSKYFKSFNKCRVVDVSCLQTIGSSAAESSTLPSFDAALGITHDKGEKKTANIKILSANSKHRS